MRQDFSGITPEKLGKLFPIMLTEYNPEWEKAYIDEKEKIEELFGNETILRISHIGSTAVKGLMAKPTVDLLVEVTENFDKDSVSEIMLDNGYVINTPPRDIIMYIKGYTPRGFEGQVYHIHVRKSGDWGELYFRDYLNDNKETADEYAELKKELKEKFPNDRDGYTDAKAEFVSKHTEIARNKYKNRYKP